MTNLKFVSIIFIITLCFIEVISSRFTNPNSTLCNDGKCLKKCCPEDQYVMYKKKKCSPYSVKLNMSLPVYDNDRRSIRNNLDNLFYLTPAAFKNVSFRMHVYEVKAIGFNVFLTEVSLLSYTV
jgi:hypothetical protein